MVFDPFFLVDNFKNAAMVPIRIPSSAAKKETSKVTPSQIKLPSVRFNEGCINMLPDILHVISYAFLVNV